jgi:hypothetical protein
MPVEEHFAFKATCEHEDKDQYNVYPTCEGATFSKDKNEDELKRIHLETFGSDNSDAEDSDYDSEEEMPPLIYDDSSDDSDAEDYNSVLGSPSLCDDSSDDEDDKCSPTPKVPQLELDPATRKLLNTGAETTNTDHKDLLKQPKPNDDSNLNVTFSDEEDDEAIKVLLMGQHDILPVPKYLLYLGWEAKFGFHDYIPLESTVYDIEDVKISIKGPIVLAAITDLTTRHITF